ncbi:MAG TPA: hypothetical protein VFR09_06160, partial [Alphaproteobacteria bacterium]|nr:hypothetical protein [Alphaproteobacteria bacterium]
MDSKFAKILSPLAVAFGLVASEANSQPLTGFQPAPPPITAPSAKILEIVPFQMPVLTRQEIPPLLPELQSIMPDAPGEYVYHQREGTLTHNGETILSGLVSGIGRARNNPALQSRVDFGVIPRGQ